MKQLVKTYTFSVSGKTITLGDFSTVRLDRIQLIVDFTTNKILYNFADSSVATATVATNVITLSALQGGEANGDSLGIFYDTITSDPIYDGGQRNMANSQPVVLASDQVSVPVAATLTDGTNIANILKSDGSAAGQNGQIVASAYLSVPFTTSTAQAVASTDVGNYGWVSVHITAQGGSSNITFQVSNDNSNWVSTFLYPTNNSGQALGSSTTNSGLIYYGTLNARYFRLNVTGIVSGSTTGTVIFSSTPRTGLSSQSVGATQSGGWNVGVLAGSAVIGHVIVDTAPTTAVTLATAPALVAGSAIIGKVTTDQTTHGTTDLVAGDITKIGGATLALGQAARSGSIPVSLASDEVVLDKFASDTAIVITLASLANSAAGVGRQSTLVDNTTNKYSSALVYLSIKMGTSPTANTPIYVYLIRSNNNAPIADDSAGASDAGLTIVNAPLLGVLNCSATTTGALYAGCFDTSLLGPLGPKWGIAVVNNTAVALDSTEVNHTKTFIGITKTL